MYLELIGGRQSRLDFEIITENVNLEENETFNLGYYNKEINSKSKKHTKINEVDYKLHLSKVLTIKNRIWKKINEDNHKIFGIGWGNFITKKELEDLKTLINDGDGNYKNLIKWDEKLMDLATKESLFVDIDNNFK